MNYEIITNKRSFYVSADNKDLARGLATAQLEDKEVIMNILGGDNE